MNASVHEPPLLRPGFACIPLIADPKAWINRRVETVEMLSHEETRRRVSIDFTLDDDMLKALTISDGVVAPISVLTKERRRNFDLRDESGRALPVLGKEQNAELAQIALVGAAFDALPTTPPDAEFEIIAADLRQVVVGSPPEAQEALATLFEAAAAGDQWREAIVADSTCLSLLDALWQNYVLFAVLPEGGANRRVLKYGYGEGFGFTTDDVRWRHRLHPARLAKGISRPDRREFVVECPGAWRARSFHAEIAIPEELRIEAADQITSARRRPYRRRHFATAPSMRASAAAEKSPPTTTRAAVPRQVSAERQRQRSSRLLV